MWLIPRVNRSLKKLRVRAFSKFLNSTLATVREIQGVNKPPGTRRRGQDTTTAERMVSYILVPKADGHTVTA